MRLYSGFFELKNGWVRVPALGRGVSWTALPPTFSERNGYRKPFLRVGKFRFFKMAAL